MQMRSLMGRGFKNKWMRGFSLMTVVFPVSRLSELHTRSHPSLLQ